MTAETDTVRERRRWRFARRDKVALALTLVVAILAFVVFSTFVSDTLVRLVRNVIDNQQYGKSYSVVRLDGLLTAATDEETQATAADANYDDEEHRRPLATRLLLRYKRVLERVGRYASWPQVENFWHDWRTNERVATLPNQSIWWTRRPTHVAGDGARLTSPRRRFLVFVHGGATFAGSPHKHNNMHWLQTIGWIGGLSGRFTDIVSVDYRLQPEGTVGDSIDDCVECLIRAVESVPHGQVDTVDLVGFSAGGMYALLLALIVESAVARGNRLSASYVHADTWTGIAARRLHLISPLVRLDRLFVNGAIDVSRLLQTFSDTFFGGEAHRYDPLFQLARLRSDLAGAFQQIYIYDVCRNSLSNHAISLARVLRHFGRRDERTLFLRLYDERHMLVDSELSKRIYEYELRVGRRPSKYLRRPQPREHEAATEHDGDEECDRTTTPNAFFSYAPSTKYRNSNPANFIHYHFFMYILPCAASWETMAGILDPRSIPSSPSASR